MATSPFDESISLDGTIGFLGDWPETPAPPKPQQVLSVTVGGAVAGPDARELAAALESLIHDHLAQATQGGADVTPPPKERATDDEGDDIEVALHGLGLETDREAALQHIMRASAREFLARNSAAQ